MPRLYSHLPAHRTLIETKYVGNYNVVKTVSDLRLGKENLTHIFSSLKNLTKSCSVISPTLLYFEVHPDSQNSQ